MRAGSAAIVDRLYLLVRIGGGAAGRQGGHQLSFTDYSIYVTFRKLFHGKCVIFDTFSTSIYGCTLLQCPEPHF